MFAAPWQAHAFAMALALHEHGVFAWSEWAATLSSEIQAAQRAGDPDFGDTYYDHWLQALESMVAAKGIASAAELGRYARAWQRAAERTGRSADRARSGGPSGLRKTGAPSFSGGIRS